MERDPRKTTAELGKAYMRHHARVVNSVQPAIMGWISIEVLEGIESIAKKSADGEVARLHAKLLHLFQTAPESIDKDFIDNFKKTYREAEKATFPASFSLQKHMRELSGVTSHHSLSSINPSVLRSFDLRAHEDPTFRGFTEDIRVLLDAVTSAPDLNRYNQAFEVYSEALVLSHLWKQKVWTKRIPEEKAAKSPDFECRLENGETFFIEVKALDIVDGKFRHNELMQDAFETQISIEEQRQSGKQFLTGETVVAPYHRSGDDESYDSNSLIRVIDTLRAKCWQAFKPGQFTRGPTIAMAVLDRLVLPGNRCALAPYYYHSNYCISGVLWQAAFGREGGPVLRHAEFEGKAAIEGYLDKPGLFVDSGHSFPGPALIALTRERDEHVAYGLYQGRHPKIGEWASEHTEEALALICQNYNDDRNSMGFEVSHYSPSTS
jgi:hypothetical protein